MCMTACCQQVAAFRAWLDGRGGGGPTPLAAGPLPPELQSKEQMLDRYSQHTRFCPSCSRVCAGACAVPQDCRASRDAQSRVSVSFPGFAKLKWRAWHA